MKHVRRPRILIVEDDPDLRVLMTLMLDGAGDIRSVGDAYQALSYARHDGVDLVVLDLLMPGANGVDLVERLRAADIPAPFVVVTGIDRGPLVDSVRALGAADVVVKPFTEDRLRSAVAEALAPLPTSGSRLTPVP